MQPPASIGSKGATIIPIGKYKGQTVEQVLAQDPEYIQWLTQQAWFVEKFAYIHSVIINGGGEAEETPDHNALQARFLDKKFCCAVISALMPKRTEVNEKAKATAPWKTLTYLPDPETIEGITFETLGVDVRFSIDYVLQGRNRWFYDCVPTPIDPGEAPKYVGYSDMSEWHKDSEKHTEQRYKYEHFVERYSRLGVNVSNLPRCEFLEHSVETAFNHQVSVEVKPSLGDDYPAVLRQMLAARKRFDTLYKRMGIYILLAGQYAGRGASFEDVKKIFETQYFYVVSMAEVEQHL